MQFFSSHFIDTYRGWVVKFKEEGTDDDHLYDYLLNKKGNSLALSLPSIKNA